ncbi:aminotransferase class V-fold PLP-dependent enzyme [Paraflavitalea speifideaquila]|uniref:aminotransferase class V-fold PLP-dependent enzyme n=1 Tax=Paraflavitalea speifideaquila TaxID=3076558 RepID=UPI0028E3DFF1|nr:aminotransferase class V-fold PLP-dependent enzyme [Paraflavitalea speifideiaquila]
MGLGRAAELCRLELPAAGPAIGLLRNQLEGALLQLEGVTINGHQQQRLPHVSNLAFQQVDGNALMLGFNKNIAVATGSACTSASMEPSFVLKALGLQDELARSSLRFSLGRFTTAEEINYTIQKVSETVNTLRALSHSNS